LKVKSFTEVPTSNPIKKMNIRKTSITIINDKAFGIPFFCSQKKGGDAMIEIKIERRNGTMIDSAAFIPATIITNEASIKST
jgi:hypothetical protein